MDDNFAINVKRTKSLLRDIIAAGAQLAWVAQISANLLRDEELVDLIAESGGKWIFIGMESLDPANLASVNKSFNKPGEYAPVLERLARRNVYAITSFIFGLDNDTPGVAERTLEQIREWPPGLPVFGQITPFPATPLYDRLKKEGRLTRPKHWLDFAPFPHGAHAFEDDHPRGAGRSPVCLDERLQPGSHGGSHGYDRGRAGALQDQPFGRALVFPRHLFPAKRQVGLVESDCGKQVNDFPHY